MRPSYDVCDVLLCDRPGFVAGQELVQAAGTALRFRFFQLRTHDILVGRAENLVENAERTGQVPFEIHEMHAKPDGFELTFTQPVDAATAGDPKSYTAREFTYIYRAEYGSPEVDDVLPTITKITVSNDKKSVRLYLDKLTKGHIHELHLDGVKSAAGLPVLHPVAYYTLNEIPAK